MEPSGDRSRYVANGYVPRTARWLTFDIAGAQWVQPGSVVVVTEGPRVVAYFHVTEVIEGR